MDRPGHHRAVTWAGTVVAAVLALGATGCAASGAHPAAGEESSPLAVATTPAAAPSSEPASVVALAKAPTTTELIAGAAPRTALAVLGTLAVKGRAPMTGYSRAAFGQAWADTDRNGCDTRDDILRRDLTGKALKAGTYGCVVLSGTLADPYTATTIHFVRGGASEVDIDHVVALGNAWVTGAAGWSSNKRLALANDPLNLLAVDSGANRQKGDGDAATWLPPNKAYRCAYVARQVAVKAKYRLWVTAPERDAVARVLSRCPQQPAPTGGNPTVAPIAGGTSGYTASPKPSTGTTGTVRTYANCTEMHQDYPGGVARPGAVNQGGKTYHQPYYSQALYDANTKSDRDKDGIACEA